MMADHWKNYIIYCYGEAVGYEIARSEKEACDLYVEEFREKHIKNFGSEPTDDMIETVSENIEAVSCD